ncbi:MAG TPA: class I SAM-dependent methyltransferase [Nitrospira sp.]|nr:class I SAM-dependent methyltransferase [Nitrospira sp.]
MLDASDRLGRLLDETHVAVRQGDDVDGGMASLIEGLWSLRRSCSVSTWKSLQPQAQRHPLREVLHSDPFTKWGFEKPRGYPGDAVLLDYTYGYGPFVERTVAEATEVGKRVHSWLMTYSGAAGIRDRRRLLAQMIDETAMAKSRSHVLAIACGHLRELLLSKALQHGAIGRFVAIDQDEESLEVVRQHHQNGKIETVRCSVKEILMDPRDWGMFDFVYAAGLYDYLPVSIAEVLVQVSFHMLNRGGRLLISNAIDTVKDAGYMELYMDWWLVYRHARQLPALLSRVQPEEIARIRQWDTPHFVYLEVAKR